MPDNTRDSSKDTTKQAFLAVTEHAARAAHADKDAVGALALRLLPKLTEAVVDTFRDAEPTPLAVAAPALAWAMGWALTSALVPHVKAGKALEFVTKVLDLLDDAALEAARLQDQRVAEQK